MGVLNTVTDFLGLTDSKAPQRQADKMIAQMTQQAVEQRTQANEVAQQAQRTQQQLTERARITEQIAAAAPKQEEPEVKLDTPAEPATRKRARFQASTDPSVSIRI